MAYNKMFLEALNNTEGLRNEDEKKRNDALDDILKVDLTLNQKNILEDTCYDSFRKAIFAHSTLWQAVNKRLLQNNPPQQSGISFIKNTFKFNPETSTHYLSEEMQSHSFIMMQQKAAEQRVKFGLKLAGPEILINILKNNDDDCREYLAGKDLTNLGIKLAEVPAWTQDKKKVLTNDALEEIKREATHLLLEELIKKHELVDPKLFKALREAQNATELKNAAIALIRAGGDNVFNLYDTDPKKLVDFLKYPLPVSITTAAKTRQEALEKAEALDHFNKQIPIYEGGLSDEILLTGRVQLLGAQNQHEEKNFPDFLALDDNAFQKQLLPKLDNISNDYKEIVKNQLANETKENAKALQQRLCAKYLEAKASALAKVEKDKLAAVIKAKNGNDLITKLKEIDGGLTDQEKIIIDKAITDEKHYELKSRLIQNFVNKLEEPEHIKKLVEAKNITEVRAALVSAIGVEKGDLDFLDQNKFTALQNAARLQLFKLQIDEVSRLGSKAHPELIKAFEGLTDEQQVDLLANKKDLLFIIKSNSPKVIQHYLGTEQDVSALVNENDRVARFKQIHNAEIARVLANFDPSFILTDKIIDDINTKLKGLCDNVLDVNTYLDLIKFIQEQTLLNKEKLYEAFCANDNKNLIKYNHPVVVKVLEEHSKNKFLLKQLVTNGDNYVAKNVYNLFLQIPKNSEFSKLVSNEGEVESKLWKVFEKSDTSEDFLNKLIPAPKDASAKALKNELSKQFTPTVFNQLKIDYLFEKQQKTKSPFSHPYNDYVEAETNKISKAHEQVFNRDLKLMPFHEFGEKGRYNLDSAGLLKDQFNELKANYEQLRNHCNTQIDYLEIELNVFKYLQAKGKDPEQNKKIQGVIMEIKKRLEWYRNRENYIANFILPEFEKASKDNKRTVYEASGFVIHEMDREDVTNMDKQVTLEERDHEGNITQEGEKVYNKNTRVIEGGDFGPTYSSRKKVPGGKVVVFNQEIKFKEGTEAEFKVKGRFSYDASPVNSLKQFVQGSENRKPARLTVIKFPTSSEKLNPQEAEKLKTEQVNFAFAFAAQLLANLDEPPSKDNPIQLKGVAGKEEELKYIWTALVILGERNPKMKFSPEAIKLRGFINFDPDDEKNWRGKYHAKNSCYERNFKEFDKSAGGPVGRFVDESIKKIEIEQDKRAESKQLNTNVQQYYMKKEMGEVREKIQKKVEHIKSKEGETQESLENKVLK